MCGQKLLVPHSTQVSVSWATRVKTSGLLYLVTSIVRIKLPRDFGALTSRDPNNMAVG